MTEQEDNYEQWFDSNTKGLDLRGYNSKSMARHVSERFFFIISRGQRLLHTVTANGSVVEAHWDTIRASCQGKFPTTFRGREKLFKYSKWDEPPIAQVVPTVAQMTYRPNAGCYIMEGGLTYKNRWRGPSIKFDPDYQHTGPDLWDEFLSRWFRVPAERDFFERWLAWTVVHPEKKVVVTPVIRADHGVGKNFLAEVVCAPLLGHANVKGSRLREVLDPHADEVWQSCLTVLDEVYANGRKDITNKLKSVLSDQTRQINPKYQAAYRQEVFANFIIFSNDKSPVYIEEGDRRYWVPEFIEHKVNKDETAAWLAAEFKPWLLDGGGLQFIRNRLQEVAEGFSHEDFLTPPETESKQSLTYVNMKDEYVEAFRAYVLARQGEDLRLPDLMEHETVQGKISQPEVRQMLKDLGLESKQKGNGEHKRRVWVWPNVVPMPEKEVDPAIGF